MLFVECNRHEIKFLVSCMIYRCYYICAHFAKFRLRLSYTCAHKSGAFALSFGVTLAPIYSQLFLGQLLVFEPRCKKIGLRGSVFESLSFLNLKPSYTVSWFSTVRFKMFHIKNQKLKCKCDFVVKRIRLKLNERVSKISNRLLCVKLYK